MTTLIAFNYVNYRQIFRKSQATLEISFLRNYCGGQIGVQGELVALCPCGIGTT